MSMLRKIKKNISSHEVRKITISNNSLYVEYKELSNIGKKWIVIKDRKTGRRLKKLIEDNKVTVSLDKLAEINRDGLFDVYLQITLLNKTFRVRTKFSPNLKLIYSIDSKNKTEIKSYKTANNNLSILSKAILFNRLITEINNASNGFNVIGEVHDFENKYPTNGEIMLVRRDTKSIYSFEIDIKKGLGTRDYNFFCNIDLGEIDNLVLNSRWDASLQLKDQSNNIIYRELINLQNYKDFSKEEDRYIITFEDECNLTSLYATMGRNSLALWYTDKKQFQTTYNIASGKTTFKKIARTEKLNEKMIFFESFLGKNYSGNPKYLYEEMLKNPLFADYTFIWSYSGGNEEVIKGNPILVERESQEYYKYLAISKYWVNNILFPVHENREGNIYIQTWHGTPLKRLGFDINIEGPETLARENLYIESRNWDYLVSANSYSTEHFKSAFKYDKEVIEVGYPANDLLYENNLEQKIIGLKTRLDIPLDKKVILYAPTWRDNETVGSWEHKFNLQFNLKQFHEKFSDEYVLILRMHHLISESLIIDEKYKSFVYDMSQFDDIQELYIISDLLITDYSSVFFDFANTKKPILFYVYDFEQYKENIRGFYLDMETELPGPLIRTEKELIKVIKNLDEVAIKFKDKYEDFYNRFCSIDDGKAAQRIISKVFEENDK